jgi:hypothetical protein
MHALVAAVLLRPTWRNALDGDAEPEPPDGKPAKIEQGVGGGKGDAVIGADSGRQPALLEQALEGGKGEVFACGLEGLAQPA